MTNSYLDNDNLSYNTFTYRISDPVLILPLPTVVQVQDCGDPVDIYLYDYDYVNFEVDEGHPFATLNLVDQQIEIHTDDHTYADYFGYFDLEFYYLDYSDYHYVYFEIYIEPCEITTYQFTDTDTVGGSYTYEIGDSVSFALPTINWPLADCPGFNIADIPSQANLDFGATNDFSAIGGVYSVDPATGIGQLALSTTDRTLAGQYSVTWWPMPMDFSYPYPAVTETFTLDLVDPCAANTIVHSSPATLTVVLFESAIYSLAGAYDQASFDKGIADMCGALTFTLDSANMPSGVAAVQDSAE